MNLNRTEVIRRWRMARKKQIQAICLWQMEDWVREGLIESEVFYVSINEPGHKSCLPDGSNVLMLHFDDLDSAIAGREDDFVLFDQSMAQKVLTFLGRVGSNRLVVHCHLGSSRSGAVACFAHELFGTDAEQFRKDHPLGLKPNRLVLGSLRDAARLPHRSLPDWCVYNDDEPIDSDSIF